MLNKEEKKPPNSPRIAIQLRKIVTLNNIGLCGDVEQDLPLNGEPPPPRDTWGNGWEFLMSCIGMSVGLGNIWKFPYTAYENGGGAFLIPYITVLFLVGKPMYYMEMVLGQFSRKGPVKVYDFVPAMRGVGVGQTIAIVCVMTYYSAVMAIILYYFGVSFSAVLPWNTCDPSWNEACYPAKSLEGSNGNEITMYNATSSTQLYFTKTVLNMVTNIDYGIGVPQWKLVICLLCSWIIVSMVLIKGVKTSGKVSYFLAIFPYIIMLILFVKALTLPGAMKGIKYFIKPNFTKILEPQVWGAAVTQSFFSLNIGFGCAIMYASFNDFEHNIYRDTMIITTLDTVASLLAGFTIFGILGYLAQITGRDVTTVVQGGPTLAFITYPEAISKFEEFPQLFSGMFFLMLYVLSVGSNVAMASSAITVIRDKFPDIKRWYAIAPVILFGFSVALIYITPGGLMILELVDRHGGNFIVYILGIGQIIAVAWIYGMRRFTDDIEFMLNKKVGLYWRICWSIVTPVTLLVILINTLLSNEELSSRYPTSAIVCGWLLTVFGLAQLPGFALAAFWKRRGLGYPKMFLNAFEPRDSWGPVYQEKNKDWIDFKENKRIMRQQNDMNRSTIRRAIDRILGF